MRARHRRTRIAVDRGRAPIAPRQANVQPVLALGNVEFVHFRGRAYGVPPVPLQKGKALLECYLEANGARVEMARAARDGERDQEAEAAYFAAMARLPALLWDLTIDARRWLRWARRFGLRRNPFREATEGELLDLAHFFYWRRTKSRDSFRPMTAAAARGTSSRT